MARIEVTVTVNGIYQFERPAYTYGSETVYIYKMTGEDGTVYVWKTTTFFGFMVDDPNGHFINKKGVAQEFHKINKGDVIRITATVKGESEYNGEKQTEVNRVKCVERIVKAKSWEEIQKEREEAKANKRREQLESLNDGDTLLNMTYKNYKEHYSDCETLEGSFKKEERGKVATITVIIREGRLKNSGSRGKHYKGFLLKNGKNEKVIYRAINEENAIKRAVKEFGGTDWECEHIYNYIEAGI